jgi:hypothetical protein
MKYKNLKSVAHNLGHSFLSEMNHVASSGPVPASARFGSETNLAVVPELIYKLAQQSGQVEVRVDFIRKEVAPPVFATPEVLRSVANYATMLHGLLSSQKLSPEAIVSARMTLNFDLGNAQASEGGDAVEIPSVECLVEIEDDRGELHRAQPTKWWRE